MSNLPIKIAYQGDTVSLDFDAIEPNGAALDLTDCTITWSLSDPEDIDTALIEKTTSDGITIIYAAGGVCRVVIPAGELDTPGQYVQELEVTHPGGATYTYGQGPFIVKPTVNPA